MGYVSAFCRTASSWITGLEREGRRAPMRGSETMKGKGIKNERERNGGDFQHAPQPLVSSPPELKKGDRARHMPGERESVCRLYHYVYRSSTAQQ